CNEEEVDCSSEVHPVNALYAFDCCSESLDYDIGFRAIIIITKGQNLNSACCRWHLLLQEIKTLEYKTKNLSGLKQYYHYIIIIVLQVTFYNNLSSYESNN
ncbi:unnamed protein product, partial [Heterotrigona itama]